MRPERLREMASVRKRPLVNSLLRTLGALVEAANAGTIPPTARWILASRLTYLRKKTSPALRPIRIGEFWRRFVAKRLLRLHGARLRRLFAEARQLGISIPGGAEAPIHF